MPHVVLSDGLRMAYREAGRGGAPLLLVHGWAAHGGFFAPQIEGLSRERRVLSVDLRGHGESLSAGEGPLTPDRLADDLIEFLDRLDLQQVTAVGWSMGAMVLWDLLSRGAGSRIAALVVEDMSPRILNDDTWRLGLRGGYDAAACRDSLAAMATDWPAYCRMLARSMLAPGPSRDRLSAFVEGELARQSPDLLAGLWRQLAQADFRTRLGGIDVPTLVVHGRHGLYEPGTARFLETALPEARRVEFTGSGHTPHLEEPELFNRTVTDFSNHALRRPVSAAAV